MFFVSPWVIFHDEAQLFDGHAVVVNLNLVRITSVSGFNNIGLKPAGPVPCIE